VKQNIFHLYLCLCLLFVPSAFFCHKKATMAQYFGRILTRFRSCRFPSFPVVSWTSFQLICCLFEATKQR